MQNSIDRRSLLAFAALSAASGCLHEPDEDGEADGTEDADTDISGDGDADDASDVDVEDVEFPVIEELFTSPDVGLDVLARQVRGNFTFTLDLLRELADDEPEANVFYSPYSVSVALAMVQAGARGTTADEIQETMQYLEGDGLHDAFGALERELDARNEEGSEVQDPMTPDDADDGDDEEDPAFRLNTANRLWPRDDVELVESYVDLLASEYDADLEPLDFAGAPEESREHINSWVADETEDRIEDLLPEGSVDGQTPLVLTNAVYFNALWSYQFDEANTSAGSFTSIDGSEHEVEFMRQSVELPYAEVDGHQLLELPYENGDTSMVLLLPAEDGYREFERGLDVDTVGGLLDEAGRPEVEMEVPKFRVESEFALSDVLQSLGMETAFTADADFSGIGDVGWLDEVFHESFVDVDEKGTEAAAATAAVFLESAPPDHVEVSFDRPFLFYVRDRPTETPLFWGRVVDGGDLDGD